MVALGLVDSLWVGLIGGCVRHGVINILILAYLLLVDQRGDLVVINGLEMPHNHTTISIVGLI